MKSFNPFLFAFSLLLIFNVGYSQQPSVRLDPNLTSFTPGQTFDLYVYFKNTGAQTSTQLGYLDVSFPDNPSVSVGSYSTEWGNTPKMYPVGSTIYTKSQTPMIAQYPLMSATWSGTITSNQEKYVRMRVTPPSSATTLTIYYRGTIGTTVAPSSSGIDVTTDQQGWLVYKKVLLTTRKITGTLTWGTDPFQKISGQIVVATNTSGSYESTTSDNNGNYTIANIPQGTYTLSIKNARSNEYIPSGTTTVTVGPSDVTKNLIYTSGATPSSRITGDPGFFVPGQPFTIRAYVGNTGNSVATQTTSIDVSFPENPNIAISTQSSGVTANIYAPSNPSPYNLIYTKSGGTLSSFYKIVWAYKTGINQNTESYVDITVTPPANATYNTLTIKYRSTIGDKHDPSSGTTTDQQGWAVKELIIKRAYSINGTLTWGTDPFQKISGQIVVATNTTGQSFESTTSDNNGNYTINAPQGTYNLSIKNAYGSEFSIDPISLVISNSDINQNIRITSRGTPSVRLEYPNTFTPGESFNMKAYIKNTNYPVSISPVYLDVSFPDDPTIEILPASTITSNIYSPSKQDPYKLLYTKTNGQLLNFYTQVIGEKIGLNYNEEVFVEIKVTPSISFSSNNMKIHVRGTIGDQRDPSSGSLLDQQGWPTEEVIITKAPVLINLQQPATNTSVNKGDLVPIQWNTTGITGTTITLKYDLDKIYNNGNETIIESGLPLAGSYSWNTRGVADGTYNILAMVDTGNGFISQYAPGTVTITSSYQISLELYKITGTDGTKNGINPGTEKTSFSPGETVRVTMRAINTGTSVPVTCVLNIFDPSSNTVFDSHVLNIDNSTDSPLEAGEGYDYYSFDWIIPSTPVYGSYSLGATMRNPNNFDNSVYTTSKAGYNTGFEDGWIITNKFSVKPINNIANCYDSYVSSSFYNTIRQTDNTQTIFYVPIALGTNEIESRLFDEPGLLEKDNLWNTTVREDRYLTALISISSMSDYRPERIRLIQEKYLTELNPILRNTALTELISSFLKLRINLDQNISTINTYYKPTKDVLKIISALEEISKITTPSAESLSHPDIVYLFQETPSHVLADFNNWNKIIKPGLSKFFILAKWLKLISVTLDLSHESFNSISTALFVQLAANDAAEIRFKDIKNAIKNYPEIWNDPAMQSAIYKAQIFFEQSSSDIFYSELYNQIKLSYDELADGLITLAGMVGGPAVADALKNLVLLKYGIAISKATIGYWTIGVWALSEMSQIFIGIVGQLEDSELSIAYATIGSCLCYSTETECRLRPMAMYSYLQSARHVVKMASYSPYPFYSPNGEVEQIWSEITDIFTQKLDTEYTLQCSSPISQDIFAPIVILKTQSNIWASNLPLTNTTFVDDISIDNIYYQINSNNNSSPSNWKPLTSDGINILPESQNSSLSELTAAWMISNTDWAALTVNAQNGGYHYIYLKVTDDAGNVYITPDQASAFKFGKDIVPPSVSISYPENGTTINESTVTAKWSVNDVVGGLLLSGVKSIHYALDQQTSFTEVAPAVSSVSLPNLASGNHTLYLYAIDHAGNQRATVQSVFTVDSNINPPLKFSLSGPHSATLQTLTPTFSWIATTDPDGTAITYELWIDIDPGFSNPIKKTSITSTSYQLTEPLTDNTIYYWKVRAIDGAGQKKWSEEVDWSFTIDLSNNLPGAFALQEPASGTTIATQTPYLNWTNSIDPDPADVISYVVQISVSPDFLAILFESSLQSASEYQLTTPLALSSTYYWRVKAIDKSGGEYIAESPFGFTTPGKSIPAITWSNPENITHGTALSNLQLNATATVPGNFEYSPSLGTILGVGANQKLSVTFTPTDLENYSVATKEVFITVIPVASSLVVTSVSPQKNMVNIPSNSNIQITFNGNINQATVDNGTAGSFNDDKILISGNQTGYKNGIFSGNGTNTINFDPNVDFKSGELVTVIITKDVKDINNNPLSKAQVFQFTVQTATAPGLFSEAENIISNSVYRTREVNAADMDNDGDLDIIVAVEWGAKISWFRNGDWQETVISTDNQLGVISVHAADINRDGIMDVISSSNGDGNQVSWYNGANNWERTVLLSGPRSYSAYPADMDGDGDMDILNVATTSNTISWFENGNNWAEKIITTAISGYAKVSAVDFDYDGDLDVLSTSPDDNSISWYENGNNWNETIITSNSQGAQVAIASDIDNDGDVEVISAGHTGNEIALYKKSASWEKSIITSNAIQAYAVFAGDVDGDGDLDIISASYGDSKIAWYENAPVNSWKETIIATNATNTSFVTAADMDGDKDLDVISSSFEGNKISWYNNNAVQIEPGLIAYYPFNGDTNDESGSGNHGTNYGSTLTKDRFGNENKAMLFNGTSNYILVPNSTSFPSEAITTAFWFNRNSINPGQGGDHYISKELSFSTYLYNDLTLASQVWKGSPGTWTSWDDGDFKLTIDNNWYFYASTFDNKTKAVNIYVNGKLVNSFIETDPNAILRTSSDPLYIGRNGSSAVYFINGKMDDIRVYNRALSSVEIETLYGSEVSNVLIPAITSLSTSTGAPGSTLTINGKNFSATAANNTVYFGATKATVTTAKATQLIVNIPKGATFSPITVTVGGLTAYSSQPFLITYPGNSTIDSSSFSNQVDLSTAESESYFTSIGDFDGDGKADLAAVNYSGNTVGIFRNTSVAGSIDANSFASRIDLTAGSRPSGIAIGDLDGDGKLDLVVTNAGSNTISVFRNASPSIGTILFESRVDFSATLYPVGVMLYDLDQDGKTEIIVANNGGNTSSGGNTISIFKNISDVGSITNTSFLPKQDFITGPNPLNVNVADLEGDGKPDLITSGNNRISILRNTTTPGTIDSKSFAEKVELSAGSGSTNRVAIGDLDGDNRLDLAVVNLHETTLSLFRNVSTPGTLTKDSFEPRVNFQTGTRPLGISFGDLDGDAKLDIAVVCENTGTVSVYKNKTTAGSFTENSFASRVEFTKKGYSYDITIGDLDGDGRPELIAGNGSNSVSILRNEEKSDLLIAYNFDDNLNDQSLSNRSGVPQGTPYYQPGFVGRGKAASFNDTWQVVIDNSSPTDFSLAGNWTMSFSINPQSNADWGNGFIQRIGDNGTCNRRGPIILINNASDLASPMTGFHGTDYFNGNGQTDNPIISGIQYGNWNRLIFVHRSDNTGDIHLNGTIIHSNISMRLADFGTKKMSLGGNYLNDGCYGQDYANNILMDDFALFGRAVSDAEIQSDNLNTPLGLTASCPVASQPSAIAGNLTVCQEESSVSYSVNNIEGVEYVWSYSGTGATLNTSGNTTSINFSKNATSGTLSVTANNSCGTSTGSIKEITVNPVPVPPDAIVGISSVCQGESTVSFSVTNMTGVTFNWSYSGAGATLVALNNTVSISFGNTSTSGTLRVTATNSCGTSVAAMKEIVVNPLPAIPSAIIGNESVCQNESNVTYSADKVTNITYQWSFSGTGATLVTTDNTVSLSFSNNATSGVLSVTATNSCGISTSSTKAITVNPLPTPPAEIIGTSFACQGENGVIYSVSKLNDLIYKWVYSGTGATLSESGNSVSINFNNNATSGTLRVTATNLCGTSVAAMKEIVVNQLPAIPSIIIGNESVCQNESNVTYSVDKVANITYQWSFSGTGATLVLTDHTVTLSFSSNATSGTLSVTATNSCGISTSSTKAITVNPLPTPPAEIIGTSSACQGENGVVYSVLKLNDLIYKWVYSGTGAILSESGNSVSINFNNNATSGTLSVTSQNTCGVSPVSTKQLIVNPLPAKPLISADFSNVTKPVLTSSSTIGNQWYQDFNPIALATGRDYLVKEVGIYSLKVTLLGCESESSDLFSVIITGDVESTDQNVSIHPNPASKILIIHGLKDSINYIQCADLTGRIFNLPIWRIGEMYEADISELSSGPYLLLIEEDNSTKKIRFIKN